MLSKITVESFKSLESVEVELGLVNVFVGANGSGKSNLLEAIGVLGAAAFGRVDDESLLRRGVRPGVPQLYKSAFPPRKSEKRLHIAFGAANTHVSYKISLWNPIDDPKPAWRFKTEVLRMFADNRKIVDRAPYKTHEKWLNNEQGYAALKLVEMNATDPARHLLDSLRNYAIYCANTPVLRGLSQDQQVREPIGLSGGRLPDAISEMFRVKNSGDEKLQEHVSQIVPMIDWAEAWGWGHAEDMPLSPAAATTRRVVRFKDRFMRPKRNILTGYDASEGALYIIFAAILALHPKAPQLFAIDNFDQALNPRLATRLASSFCTWVLESKTGKQVLLTSHNPAVLDGLPLQDDRVRLFTVDRDNRGATVVKRVELTEGLIAKSKEGWTLSRMWVNSLIGGVPDV